MTQPFDNEDWLLKLIQEKDAQIKELQATIEALKLEHEEMLLKHVREQNIALSTLEGALKELQRLKGVRGPVT